MTIFLKRVPNPLNFSEVGSISQAAARVSPGGQIIADSGHWSGTATLPPNVSLINGSYDSITMIGGEVTNATIRSLNNLENELTITKTKITNLDIIKGDIVLNDVSINDFNVTEGDLTLNDVIVTNFNIIGGTLTLTNVTLTVFTLSNGFLTLINVLVLGLMTLNGGYTLAVKLTTKAGMRVSKNAQLQVLQAAVG